MNDMLEVEVDLDVESKSGKASPPAGQKGSAKKSPPRSKAASGQTLQPTRSNGKISASESAGRVSLDRKKKGLIRRKRRATLGPSSDFNAAVLALRALSHEDEFQSPSASLEQTLSDHSTLNLPERLDLSEASALRDELLRRRGQSLTIDAGSVRRVGGQCLQVLLSAAKTWQSDGQSLDYVNFAQGMLDDLVVLGVEPNQLMTKELSQ